ncbi:hypothetical protein BJ170DRAFT_163413 [Xylariales sp. AK1849]|nr:hypothetical protein BJ170DRAFT_163413 [Xylariales sp. AK1849]
MLRRTRSTLATPELLLRSAILARKSHYKLTDASAVLVVTFPFTLPNTHSLTTSIHPIMMFNPSNTNTDTRSAMPHMRAWPAPVDNLSRPRPLNTQSSQRSNPTRPVPTKQSTHPSLGTERRTKRQDLPQPSPQPSPQSPRQPSHHPSSSGAEGPVLVTLPDGCTFRADEHFLPLRPNSLDPAGGQCTCQDDARAIIAAYLVEWRHFALAELKFTPKGATTAVESRLKEWDLRQDRLNAELEPGVADAVLGALANVRRQLMGLDVEVLKPTPKRSKAQRIRQKIGTWLAYLADII